MSTAVCPICESTQFLSRVDLLHCQDCTHLFQFPAAIRVKYDADYLATYSRYPEEAMSHLRVGFLKSFVQGGRLLDVGYGTGSFVRTAMKAGFDAYGTDVHGVDCGVRECSLASDESWDVVTFFDSLEHFVDLSVVRDLGRRAGLVVVSLPKTPRDFALDQGWRHYKPGEHLHYFNEQSIARLFEDKKLLATSDVEDAVRGRLREEQNILTVVLG